MQYRISRRYDCVFKPISFLQQRLNILIRQQKGKTKEVHLNFKLRGIYGIKIDEKSRLYKVLAYFELLKLLFY
jgi:hypothetical protein